MCANRITLDFVKHDAARVKIQSKLDEKGATDECITDLHIATDGGYVYYKVTLRNRVLQSLMMELNFDNYG